MRGCGRLVAGVGCLPLCSLPLSHGCWLGEWEGRIFRVKEGKGIGYEGD
jgi:hypothetical protein